MAIYVDPLFQNSYVISAKYYDERGRKMGEGARVEWEKAQYSQAGIPPKDLKIPMQVKQNAKNIDARHRIGPLKFGKGNLIGWLPVFGDFADVFLAYWDIYLPARKISKGDDIPVFKSRMKLRIVALGCVGLFPLVGNIAVTIIK